MTKIYGPDANLIARLVERARREGLTRKRLAAEIGITDRTLRRWMRESGNNHDEAYRQLFVFVRGVIEARLADARWKDARWKAGVPKRNAGP